MIYVDDGVYRIGNGTVTMSLNGQQVILMPPNGDSSQSWRVQNQDNGNVTIQNVARRTYLSYEGDPEDGNLLCVFPDFREWQLKQGPDDGEVLLVAPNAPYAGQVLVAGTRIEVIPPPMFLIELLGDGSREELTFESVG